MRPFSHPYGDRTDVSTSAADLQRSARLLARNTLSRTGVLAALAALVCLPLVGCGATAQKVSAQSRVASASAATQKVVAPGQGGPGSVTLSVTQPVNVSGHVDVPVSCTTTKRSYLAETSSATVEGYAVSFRVLVAGYAGPGTYPSTVTVTLTEPDGTSTSLAGRPQIPATISATGGSFSLNATGTGGRTLAASITWMCSQ